MSEYVLSCCSTADLTKEHFDRRNIRYICFHYFLNGTQYPDDLGQTLSFPQFYQAMRDGADTSTSQINVSEYLAYFTDILASGKDLLHISLSSGLSGSVQSARAAAQMALEQFPERKLFVVDSLAASSGFGLLMDRLADLREEGYSIEQLRDWVEANKMKMHHWFSATDLTFFVKGGRVSKTAGAVGGMLNICPVMNVDKEGHLIVRKKVMGKKRALAEIVSRMEECAENGLDYNQKCYICNSDCLTDAQALADAVERRFPKLNGRVEIFDIGTTIGSHSGPGTFALFFWGSERVD